MPPSAARAATDYGDNNDATNGFVTAAGTITVSGPVDAGHLHFGNYSGAITLSGASRSITVNKAFNIRLGKPL